MGKSLNTGNRSVAPISNSTIADTLLDEINDAVRWSVSADHNFYWAANTTTDAVAAGLYEPVEIPNRGIGLARKNISRDGLVLLPDNIHMSVYQEITNFWGLKDKFTQFHLLHKRGILLWGDPGSGKTSLVQFLIQDIINRGGVAIYSGQNIGYLIEALHLLRKIEPNRPIVLIAEDFETLVENRQAENAWLALLDGEMQIDNIVTIATTNYPEKIDKRFMDRPSRFDIVIPISMPGDNARKAYIQNKIPDIDEETLKKWVILTKGFGVAHIKETIIGVYVFGHTLENVVKRLKIMQDRSSNSSKARDGNGTISFINEPDVAPDHYDPSIEEVLNKCLPMKTTK